MSDKRDYELLDKIKYSILEWIAFILLIIFTINPFIKGLFQRDTGYFTFMRGYNRNVLLIGALIFAIYLIKLRVDGKLPHIKELLKKHIAVTLFLVFGILMIITTLLNGAPEIAIVGDHYRGEGLRGFLSYIIYFLLAAFLLSEKRKRIVVYLFLITSTLVGGMVLVDYISYNNVNYIFHNTNHLGYYLLMSIMFYGMMFVAEKKILLRIGCLCGFIFMTVVLIWNNTWGCQLALLVGIIFTIIVYSIGKGKFQPKPLVLLLAMVLTFVMAYFSDDRLKASIETNITQQIHDTNILMDKDDTNNGSAGTGRMRLWEYTFQYLMERPLIGHGADVTGDRLDSDTGNHRCHCEFLNYAVSFGVPTTVVYIVAIFMVFLRGLKMKRQLTDMNYAGLCVAFAYLASSLVGNSMYYTAPFLFIALGMGYVKKA